MADLGVIEALKNARIFARQLKIEEAEEQYLKAVNLLESKLETDKSEIAKIEYLTTKSEYLTFRAKFMKKEETIRMSNDRAVDALKNYHEALKINTDKSVEEILRQNERALLNQTIKVFGCKIPENETHYIFKCPIRIRELYPRNGVSPSILYKDPTCSICGKPIMDSSCNHLLGEKYDDRTAGIDVGDMEFLELSQVDRPRDKRAGIASLYIPKQFVDKTFTEEEMKTKIPGAGIFCHYCREGKIEPNEITYDLFIEMQKTENISVSERMDPNSVKKDGIYFKGVIPIDEIIEKTRKRVE